MSNHSHPGQSSCHTSWLQPPLASPLPLFSSPNIILHRRKEQSGALLKYVISDSAVTLLKVPSPNRLPTMLQVTSKGLPWWPPEPYRSLATPSLVPLLLSEPQGSASASLASGPAQNMVNSFPPWGSGTHPPPAWHASLQISTGLSSNVTSRERPSCPHVTLFYCPNSIYHLLTSLTYSCTHCLFATH